MAFAQRADLAEAEFAPLPRNSQELSCLREKPCAAGWIDSPRFHVSWSTHGEHNRRTFCQGSSESEKRCTDKATHATLPRILTVSTRYRFPDRQF
jgi:hypothetical protein